MENLDTIDHIAIQVKSIDQACEWYQQHFACKVIYQDDTWAILAFANIKLALVTATQHPPHFAILADDVNKYGNPRKHRDQSESVYIKDCDDNQLEIISYPNQD